ncbi:MAG: endolytic transglycosylase MltG [Acidimicrobiia bacterium]
MSDPGPPVDADSEPIGVLAGERRRRRRAPRRRRTGLLFLLLGVLALPIIAIAGWYWYQLDPPGDPGKAVTVTIPKGDGVAAIADRLAGRGVIGSSLAFQVYARVDDHRRFQAGEYRLRRNLGVEDAVAVLERGPRQRYTTLALPPGLTFAQIADRIGRLPGLSAVRAIELAASGAVRSRFEPLSVQSLEGLTWPDSYEISDHETEADVLKTIVDAFDTHATALGLRQAADSYRAVIVASLIQREAGVESDRPLIAAVVENRLRAGMPLQVDATVLYARGGGDGTLTDADFQRDSPYNTYRVKGLPPTPISTVTGPSLTAALHPASVPYLYYVLTDTSGKHAFAVTFAEHERNIADARRRGVIK